MYGHGISLGARNACRCGIISVGAITWFQINLSLTIRALVTVGLIILFVMTNLIISWMERCRQAANTDN